MNSFFVVAAVLAVAVAFADGKATILEEDHVKWYSCVGKPAGNYMHPTNCNKFMSCSAGGVASQRDCASCGPISALCPEGDLRWNATTKNCEWAATTPCVVAGGDDGETSSETPRPTTAETSGPTSSEAPPQQEECDPDLCLLKGECNWYDRCDNSTGVGKLVREKCDPGLVWNPRNSDGSNHIHGGKCDTWANLPDDLKHNYSNDKECFACGWWLAEEGNGCNSKYLYRPPNGTTTDKTELSCAGDLIFDLTKETCRRCENVLGNDGNNCC